MSQPPSSPDDPTRAGQGPYGEPAPQNSPYQSPSYPSPPTHQPYGGSGSQSGYGQGGYGQDPYGQGSYGQNPYGQGYPPNPYGQQPTPKKSGGKTALWIVGIIVVVVLVVCGGIIGLGVWAFNSIEGEIDDGDGPGTNGNPITLTEGEAFDIEDFSFEEGWQITGDDFSDEITGLVAMNDGDQSDSVSITFTFLDGNSEVGEIRCNSDGDIADGNNEELGCSGYDTLGQYKTIKVENSYDF